jgi:hypothetical protein
LRSGDRGDRREPGGEAADFRGARSGGQARHALRQQYLVADHHAGGDVDPPPGALRRPPFTLLTSQEAFDEAFEFARAVGKDPIAARDNSGFIVNRLLVPYLLDAIRAYEEGVGSVEDIDKGMQMGCGHPMGPFTLLDFVGLDTTYYIANIMFDEYREKRFAPPHLLKQMVLAGRLGKKSGRGFYDYGKKK